MKSLFSVLLALCLLLTSLGAFAEEEPADDEMTADVWATLSETQNLPEEARELEVRGTLFSAIARGDTIFPQKASMR